MISGYIFGRLLVAEISDCLSYRVDQVVCSFEVGSCSLQEKQMLARSVEALICRRNCYGDQLTQSPCAGLAAP
jgi:hypothetical protein